MIKAWKLSYSMPDRVINTMVPIVLKYLTHLQHRTIFVGWKPLKSVEVVAFNRSGLLLKVDHITSGPGCRHIDNANLSIHRGSHLFSSIQFNSNIFIYSRNKQNGWIDLKIPNSTHLNSCSSCIFIPDRSHEDRCSGFVTMPKLLCH